jgi:hypothetical protein
MRVAVDIDGTLDANPREMQSIMSALVAAGHIVSIVTGTSDGSVTQNDWDNKAAYVASLGCAECWSDLTVVAHGVGNGNDLATQKAQWLVDNGVDVYFDNTVANIKAANKAGIKLCVLPWGSRIKDNS